MRDDTAAFVAFLEQDNLGVGYMASVLLQNEFAVKIIDFRMGHERVLAEVIRCNPIVVGFSIIFQYHINDFRLLAAYLREHGVTCHFSAGGHYPSLRYEELLNFVPGLDSVVLFEGEYTFLELAGAIRANKEWRNIQGIAYRKEHKILANNLRPLEEDLDRFPPPVRQPLREYALGKKYATILAGRGCYYDCAFCSIREFYSKPPGSVKRLRRPEMVVREIELLREQRDCSVFMFQDDDFPVAGAKGRRWASRFCELMTETGLCEETMWKINCRPDEIRPDLFERMRDSGLFLVYLGIEHGTDKGLQLMNKHATPQASIDAVSTLKSLGIGYDFGFMLFHPESDFDSIWENLRFLQTICGDGSSPITFCKMLPYAETRIEYILRQEGRLEGKPGFEDYDFHDASLDRFYSFVMHCFGEWLGAHDGVLNLARWARYYLYVYKKYFKVRSSATGLERTLSGHIADSNEFVVRTLERLLTAFDPRAIKGTIPDLDVLANSIKTKHSQFRARLNEIIERIGVLEH